MVISGFGLFFLDLDGVMFFFPYILLSARNIFYGEQSGSGCNPDMGRFSDFAFPHWVDTHRIMGLIRKGKFLYTVVTDWCWIQCKASFADTWPHLAYSIGQIIMDRQSLLSSATAKSCGEISDSNSGSHQSSSANFKGVVSQSNGHWGAQIYANHQRIWLGTFKSEKEAAMAYDSAAIKIRPEHAPRNFPWSNLTTQELNFQSQFSTEAILSMIKDGSYRVRLSDFLTAQDQQGYCLHISSPPSFQIKQLFQKVLTPSDVSKLNRLVIPKRYAVKYFPGVSDAKKLNKNSYNLELVFFDPLMRSWKFSYCYWQSSQSFVFTKGWNRFAKEYRLKARDRVIFSSYQYRNQKRCMIEVAHDETATANDGHGHGEYGEAEDDACREEVEELKPNTLIPNTGFKLFGVHIM